MIICRNKIFFSGFIFVVIHFLFCSSLYAGGFTVYGHNIDSAMSISTIANTLGSSSNIFNPALLPEIDGNQLSASTTIIEPTTKYTDDTTGVSEESKDFVAYPSSLSAVYHFNDKLSGGFAIYNPFGSGMYYQDDWSGRYAAVTSELKTFNFNPNIAYRISKNFNISIGLDAVIGETTITQKIRLLSDATNEFSGSGYGMGFNIGGLWKVTDKMSMGISYRSKIKMDISGDFTFSDVPTEVESFVSDSEAQVDLNLPSLLFLGVAYQLTDKFLFEIGGKIEDWSEYKELRLNLDQTVLGLDTLVIPKNWDKTYIYNMGAKYDYTPTTAILMGYCYQKDPIPDETFDATVPDAPTNIFTMGFIKQLKHFKLSVYYAFEDKETRKKSNDVGLSESSPLAGIFESSSQTLGFAVTIGI